VRGPDEVFPILREDRYLMGGIPRGPVQVTRLQYFGEAFVFCSTLGDVAGKSREKEGNEEKQHIHPATR
jgi:hypothetical protein